MTIEAQEKKLLEELIRSQKIEFRYRERVGIILNYDKIGSKRGVGRYMDLDRQKVSRWVDRWGNQELVREELYEQYQSKKLSYNGYKKEIVELLSDKYRTGCPPKFTLSQREKIVALGSTKPEDLDLPFTHWSLELLREEAISREIVANISVRQVGRFLKSAQITASFK